MPRVRFKALSRVMTMRPRLTGPHPNSALPGASDQSPYQKKSMVTLNLQSMAAPNLGLPRKQGTTPSFSDVLGASVSKNQSPGPKLPGQYWSVNREQNALKEVNINPADIDPTKERGVLEEEARLYRENSKFESAEFQVRQRNVKVLQDHFAFPLQVDQLYTPYDLSIEAWRQRQKVKYAAYAEAQDPFDRIGVDPFWEYKFCIIDGTNITYESNRLFIEESKKAKQGDSSSKGIRIYANLVPSSSTESCSLVFSEAAGTQYSEKVQASDFVDQY